MTIIHWSRRSSGPFTAATTFGITRYRVPSEVALCILAGLGLAWVTLRDAPVEA